MLQAFFKQIAQADVAVMVETTRHNGSVDKDAYLIAQCMTEHLLVVCGMLKVGPFKHIVVLYV